MRVAFAGQVSKDLAFPDDIEDAMAFATEAGRVAISDGASESYDSRSWAQLLVRRFIADTRVDLGWLDEAIGAYGKQSDFTDLSWSHQDAFDRGSFASLLGIEYLPEQKLIEVCCVGDSLAVLIDRQGCRRRAFQYLCAALFGRRPQLLSTHPARNTRLTVPDFFRSHTEAWPISEPELRVVLCMTDAMGEWALRHDECGRPVWNELLALHDQTDLDVLVAEARESRGMHIDDVTLVRLSFDD